MIEKFKRFGRMARMLVRGEITFRSFRMALRPEVIAVCRKHGGMVFCQASTAKVYFGDWHE